MRILGLTGSIGMGKSTAAAMLRRLGVPVFDSDAAVHRLLAKGGAAVPKIRAAFPDAVKDGAVDRQTLGARVFADPAALRRLESIVHPLVRREEARFLRAAGRRRTPLVVLDIPLLFESRGEGRCDATLLVSAPRAVQEARVLGRPGMTRAKLAGIRSQQMPEAQKRRRADFIVLTGGGKRRTFEALRRIVRALRRGPMRERRGSRHA
ncbi:MAG TPA: dephospho-CoA kinase [Alphaproteobacteria bacterium]|jgi:dephospho-CoA kinase|nr:dephospho-CoA kinase [Alphaproteobacteria bacterium]